MAVGPQGLYRIGGMTRQAPVLQVRLLHWFACRYRVTDAQSGDTRRRGGMADAADLGSAALMGVEVQILSSAQPDFGLTIADCGLVLMDAVAWLWPPFDRAHAEVS